MFYLVAHNMHIMCIYSGPRAEQSSLFHVNSDPQAVCYKCTEALAWRWIKGETETFTLVNGVAQ